MAVPQATIRSFRAPLRGPGRTAPLLLEDLLLFDPRQDNAPETHLLADGARTFASVPYIGQLLPPGSCTHEFCSKPRQSIVPLLDERPTAETIWQIAAVCKRCRVHILLQVDFRAAWQAHPCPSYENPLHHLVKSSWRRDLIARESSVSYPYNNTGEIHVYECSATQCAAVVTIHLMAPALSDHHLHTLLDPDLLRQRTDAAFAEKKGFTEGMVRPMPIDVLSDLRAYLRNSWRQDAQARISLDNKRFVVRFGPEGRACSEILQRLGFEFTEDNLLAVPQPDRSEPLPVKSEINVFLDNVEAELDILIANRPVEERQLSHDQTKLDFAWDNMKRTLGAQNYDKTPLSRTKARTRSLLQRPRSFTILGIPDDASDDLVIFAYKRQVAIEIDARRIAQYVTALEDVQKLRQTEKLGEQVAIEWSQGRYGEGAVADAFRTLGLAQTGDLTDEVILGTYNARLQDAPSQGPQMREALGRIGQLRNSQRLINYARNDVSTYDDALEFLEASHNVDDQFIVSMFTAKISDNASDQEMAQKALRIIAEHRQSAQLHEFVGQGYQADTLPPEMDIGDAYKVFAIEDRTMDDDTMWMVYTIFCTDHPDDAAKALQAITTIAKHTESIKLKEYLGLEDGQQPVQNNSLSTEPIGLDNIGNTCYLNSLLQSLYTIVPVREIVLNCDQYWQDPDLAETERKRTGQRLVLRREVITAQRFVRQLAELFLAMKDSPIRAIRPSQELARLTLDTASLKERRNSTLKSPRRATLGMIDSRPIMGPLPAPMMLDGNESAALDSPEATAGQSATKQLDASLADNELQITHDTKLNSTDDVIMTSPEPAERKLESLEIPQSDQVTADTDETNKEEGLSNAIHMETDTNDNDVQEKPKDGMTDASHMPTSTETNEVHEPALPQYGPKYEPPEGKPPPIPPRPNTVATLEAYARQQDVTEVLGHAIFQLSCAIRARGFDETGEQQDEIHDTFFGVEQVHVLKGDASPKPPVQFLFLYLPIYNHPKDLYAAIDNEFDPEERGSSEVYNTITKLPPVLCMQLGRTGADNRKVNNHVEIPPIIYMDRYLDAPKDSVLVNKRTEIWNLKKELTTLQSRISQLEPQGKSAIDQALDDATAAVRQLQEIGINEASNDLVSALEAHSHMVKDERQRIHDRIRDIESQMREAFEDESLKQEEYTLHAAFFHRGTMGSGHYWVYILDHVHQVWRKYNDDYVTRVTDLKEIFENPENDRTNKNWSSSNPANPYFLLYVRSGRTASDSRIVETVLRDPKPQEPVQTWPTESEDALRPLGTDAPNTNTDNHDATYAGQPSQMSHMPPNGAATHANNDVHEWEQVNIDSAVEESLKDGNGTWTHVENTNVPPGGW